MAARPVTIKDRSWYKQEREPAKAHDHLVVIDPHLLAAVKDLPRISTVQQVADFLKVSKWAVYDYCREWDKTHSHGLRHQTLKGRIRIIREDVATFLMLQTVTG